MTRTRALVLGCAPIAALLLTSAPASAAPPPKSGSTLTNLALPGWKYTHTPAAKDKDWRGGSTDPLDPCLVQGTMTHPQTGQDVFMSIDMTKTALVPSVDPKDKSKGTLVFMGKPNDGSLWFVDSSFRSPNRAHDYYYLCRKGTGSSQWYCDAPTMLDFPANEVTAPGTLVIPFGTKASAQYFANQWNQSFQVCKTAQARSRVASVRFGALVNRLMTNRNAKGQSPGISPSRVCSMYDARWGTSKMQKHRAEYANTTLELTSVADMRARCTNNQTRKECQRRADKGTALDFKCKNQSGNCASAPTYKGGPHEPHNLRLWTKADDRYADGLKALFAVASKACGGYAAGQAANQKTCENAIQGKIVWDHKSNKSWSSKTVKQVCQGVETSSEPGKCLSTLLEDGLEWGGGKQWGWSHAVNLCEGTTNASQTLSCFTSNYESRGWKNAITHCDAR